MRVKLILWTLTIVWAIVISLFSAQPAEDSNQLSQSATKQVVKAISEICSMSDAQQKKVETELHDTIRTVAHFINFTILGLLLYLLCKSYGLSLCHAILLALIISVFYAFIDEIHQKFVPGRTFQWVDILVDSFGSVLGICMLPVRQFVLKKHHKA